MCFKCFDNTAQIKRMLKNFERNPSQIRLIEILNKFPKVPFYYHSLQPILGPDRFPYVNLLFTGDPAKKVMLREVAEQVINEGYGVTVNRTVDHVDWVFSLGDLVPLARSGILIWIQGEPGFQSITFTTEVKVMVCEPGEDMIPKSVRKKLRDYIQNILKFPNPKFYMMHNFQDSPPWTIMFNFSRENFASDSEYQNALYSLTWFFPKTVYVGNVKSNKGTFYDI